MNAVGAYISVKSQESSRRQGASYPANDPLDGHPPAAPGPRRPRPQAVRPEAARRARAGFRRHPQPAQRVRPAAPRLPVSADLPLIAVSADRRGLEGGEVIRTVDVEHRPAPRIEGPPLPGRHDGRRQPLQTATQPPIAVGQGLAARPSSGLPTHDAGQRPPRRRAPSGASDRQARRLDRRVVADRRDAAGGGPTGRGPACPRRRRGRRRPRRPPGPAARPTSGPPSGSGSRTMTARAGSPSGRLASGATTTTSSSDHGLDRRDRVGQDGSPVGQPRRQLVAAEAPRPAAGQDDRRGHRGARGPTTWPSAVRRRTPRRSSSSRTAMTYLRLVPVASRRSAGASGRPAASRSAVASRRRERRAPRRPGRPRGGRSGRPPRAPGSRPAGSRRRAAAWASDGGATTSSAALEPVHRGESPPRRRAGRGDARRPDDVAVADDRPSIDEIVRRARAAIGDGDRAASRSPAGAAGGRSPGGARRGGRRPRRALADRVERRGAQGRLARPARGPTRPASAGRRRRRPVGRAGAVEVDAGPPRRARPARGRRAPAGAPA